MYDVTFIVRGLLRLPRVSLPLSPAFTLLSGRASDYFCIAIRFHGMWKKSTDHFTGLIFKGGKITHKSLFFVFLLK